MLISLNKKNYRLIFGGILLSLIVLFLVLATPQTARAITIEPVYKVLATSEQIKDVWKQILVFVNSIAIVMLLFIAFANILRININTYGIKKFLPSLALAIVAANFSYLFCRILVDFSNVASDLLLHGTSVNNTAITGAFDFTKYTVTGIDIYPRIFFLAILEFVGAVAIAILAFMFFIRTYVIYFLVALSPIAIVCMVLPMTKSVFNMWWQQFWKWTFMPVVSLFWLWIGGLWIGTVAPDTSGSAIAGTGILPGSSIILGVAFAIVCYYLAITTPQKMGSGIMTSWNNLGRWGWGKTGGAALGAAGEYGKRKAGVWWSGQAASANKLNPLGHIARARINLKDAAEFDKERIANNQEKALGNIMRLSRSGRDRTKARDTFGGEAEKAKAEVLGEHYTRDKAAAKAKAAWLDEKATAEQKLATALAQGRRLDQESDAGKARRSNKLILNEQALEHESRINELQKKTTIDFLTNAGEFQSPEAVELLKNKFLSMTRNLTFDEVIKKESQKRIDTAFNDQLHLGNMADQIRNIDKDLNAIDDFVAERVQGDITAIQEKINNGTATRGERLRFTDLNGDLAILRSGGTNARIDQRKQAAPGAIRNEIAQAAKEYYQAKVDAGEGQHIIGMIDMSATRPEDIVQGFKGLAVSQGFDGKIGELIATRVGKLTSIEIKGDIDKILEAKTPDEIADDLNPLKTTIGKDLKLADGRSGEGNPALTRQVLKNYREGRRYLNDPQTNREIEARNLALAKTAKQLSNADAPVAAASLASMMSDGATIGAKRAFNRMLDIATRTAPKSALAQQRIPEGADANTTRQVLESYITTQGRVSKIAYSSVMRQPSMGASQNAGQYLSTTDSSYAGYHQNSSVAIPGINPNQLTRSLVAAINQSPGNLSYSSLSRALGSGLPNNVAQLDEIKTVLGTQSTRFARDVAREMKIPLRPELRSAFIAALAQLPKNATPQQIAAKVQEVVPGSAPAINAENVPQMLTKADNITKTKKAAQLLEQQQNAADHNPYIDHFSHTPRESAEEQARILSEAKDQISHNPNSQEALTAVSKALQQTGFAPAQASLTTGSQQIDQLMMAEQAAQAALKAYDNQGRFDKDRATDNLVESFIERNQRLEETGNGPNPPAGPGPHRDITPPPNQ